VEGTSSSVQSISHFGRRQHHKIQWSKAKTADQPSVSIVYPFLSNDYTSNEATSYNDSGDYSIYGEYKPVETMTQEEIREELEAILRNTLSGN